MRSFYIELRTKQFFLSDHLSLAYDKDFQNGDKVKSWSLLECSKRILFATYSSRSACALKYYNRIRL